MERPPILMVIPALPMGGAETFFVRLALGLKGRGHDVTVYLPTLDGDKSLIESLNNGGVDVVCPWWRGVHIFRYVFKVSITLNKLFPSFTLVDFLDRRKLRMLWRRKRFLVANAHLTLAELLVCKALWDTDVRIVGSDHGDYRWAVHGKYLHELSVVLRRSDALVCPSEDNRRVAQKFAWGEKTSIEVIKYGFQFPESGDRHETRQRPFTFGMVSRGIEQKGWMQAIEGFRKALDDPLFDANFILVGEGPAISRLRDLVNSSEALKSRVVFAGYQASPEPFIRQFDVGVLPSYYEAESLPNVIIEYLAHSIPVIATRWAGIPEMIETSEGTAGHLISLCADGMPDVDQIAESMVRLAGDSAHYDFCLERVAVARKAFEIERCVDAYEDVFFGSHDGTLNNRCLQ